MVFGELLQFALLIILLGSSAFFSASETALMSLSKVRIRHMADEKIKGAALVQKLTNNPSRLLGAILVGNNVVNIGASAIATSLAIKYYGDVGVGIATGIMTLLVLVFAEITPKSLAVLKAEKISLQVAGPINLITVILSPIIVVLTYLTNNIIKLFGAKIDSKKPFITEEELITMVNVSHEEGVLDVDEKQMIHNVFEFGDSQVKDVMTQRTDMTALDINASYEALICVIKEDRYSRIPIFEGDIDNIVGVLHVKDLFLVDNIKENFTVKRFMREPFYTYEHKKINLLFEEMRLNRTPISIVLDEYGGTAGMVTIEDLVEEIVGDIHDEYDNQEGEIERLTDGQYIVKGNARIDLVNDQLGTAIKSEDFDSIGGFILGLFGRLPKVREVIEYKNIEFLIDSIDKNRIKKVRIKILD